MLGAGAMAISLQGCSGSEGSCPPPEAFHGPLVHAQADMQIAMTLMSEIVKCANEGSGECPKDSMETYVEQVKKSLEEVGKDMTHIQNMFAVTLRTGTGGELSHIHVVKVNGSVELVANDSPDQAHLVPSALDESTAIVQGQAHDYQGLAKNASAAIKKVNDLKPNSHRWEGTAVAVLAYAAAAWWWFYQSKKGLLRVNDGGVYEGLLRVNDRRNTMEGSMRDDVNVDDEVFIAKIRKQVKYMLFAMLLMASYVAFQAWRPGDGVDINLRVHELQVLQTESQQLQGILEICTQKVACNPQEKAHTEKLFVDEVTWTFSRMITRLTELDSNAP